ncbi:MAG: hypothetical protein NT016_01745 [Candidatus Aenigmarchaeota archaeon]|nr:hypothetical protein [Candidatus Aenigmarchaeota archaeon]
MSELYPDESYFKILRKHGRFCVRCGGRLGLETMHGGKWHFPFCPKCRTELLESGDW